MFTSLRLRFKGLVCQQFGENNWINSFIGGSIIQRSWEVVHGRGGA